MKNIIKFLGIIAVAAVIGFGLSGCISIAPAAERTAEEVALENALTNARWNARSLASEPSFDGFVRMPSASVDFGFFRFFGDRLGQPVVSANTWYELTSQDLPGVVYYFFRQGGGAVSHVTLYKSDSEIIPFPGTGRWQLSGYDRGEDWTADMVILQMDGNSFNGFFDWAGPGNFGGREYFRGTYDVRTRGLSIQGYRLANPRNIGIASYQAILSTNGRDIESGRWTGGGVWAAIKQN